MSQENVEVVRRFFEALSRQDYEVASTCLQPDAEWRNTSSFPGSQTLVGARAIFEFWDAMIESLNRVGRGGSNPSRGIAGEPMLRT